jgi:hypothetical protein
MSVVSLEFSVRSVSAFRNTVCVSVELWLYECVFVRNGAAVDDVSVELWLYECVFARNGAAVDDVSW